MLATVHKLGLNEIPIKKLLAIIEAMQGYVDGHINEIMECWKQQQGETFDNYFTSQTLQILL